MKITDELLYAHAAAGQALWLSTLPDPAELSSPPAGFSGK